MREARSNTNMRSIKTTYAERTRQMHWIGTTATPAGAGRIGARW